MDHPRDLAMSALGFVGIMAAGFAAGVGVSYRIAWRWLYRPREW